MYLLLLVLAFTSNALAKRKFDEIVKPCSLSDPKLNECATKTLQDLLPVLSNGIKEYNFPPMNPLRIPFMALSTVDSPAGIDVNVTDTTHVYLPSTTIQAVRIDPKAHQWEVDAHTAHYTTSGHCITGGRRVLTSLPAISGEGSCNITVDNIDIKLVITGILETRNGKEYFKLKNVSCKLFFTGGTFQNEGFFNGNKQIGAIVDKFLNDNSGELLELMKPAMSQIWAEVYHGLASRIVDNVPYNQLFRP